jgi:DNA-binding CsgD family transcriptional regulator
MIGTFLKIHLGLIILLSLAGYGQIKHIGAPNIYNYPKAEYKAGTQNWGICQDDNGFMYFANNEGVLIFNGMQWNRVQVSLSKPIRSVFQDAKNSIYIGLLNDFGTLKYEESGDIVFKSLRHLLADDINDFDDIWKIHETTEGIVFQTYEYMFVYNGSTLKTIKPRNAFHFSFYVNKRLYAHEPGEGIFEYIDGEMQLLPWSIQMKDLEIREIIATRNGDLLVCTNMNGIYKLERGELQKWTVPVDQLVKQYKIFSAKVISDNYIAFGTILNGLIISDFDGRLVQHINSRNGLQNNTVLSVYAESNGNLWLGLDNGIDYIELNSPISYLSDSKKLGTGYTARIFKDKLYLGTNQGLFVRDFYPDTYMDAEFELVRNTAGQVWSLYIFEDQLLCGHHNGTYLINDHEAIMLCENEGGWKFIPLLNKPGFLLGGHYDGMVLLKEGLNGWEFHTEIEGFDESCRFLQQDKDGIIWVSHGAKGVYRIQLNDDFGQVINFERFDSENGLPSDENNIVFKFSGEIFFSTMEGNYIFDNTHNRFVPSERLNKIFDVDGRLKTFEKDDDGNIWFIAQNESGVLRLNEDNTYTRVSKPFTQLNSKYVNEFEFIYPFSKDHIFVGIDNGFAHYSSRITKSYTNSFPVFITAIEIPNMDSVIYPIHNYSPDRSFKFPFQKNSFRLHFTSPFYENLEQTRFSYLLENYASQWSEWTQDNYKDLANLPDGKYVFRLKAMNIYGVESDEASFSFSIVPPWYRTNWAFVIYFILFVILLILLLRYMRYRIRKSRKKEALKYRQEMLRRQEQFEHKEVISEKEIIRLRNEKLRADMIHKDKELANQTMNIIQKNKFLSEVRTELEQIKIKTEDPQLRNKVLTLNRRLEREIDDKNQKKVFNTYFEEVHESFFNQIKEIHPDLSPRELHLCAYIRMNLSTKEIATLLNISHRGVEIGRYRLRKKLKLSRDNNLSVYLSNI